MSGYRIVRQFLSQGKSATGVWRCELCGCMVGHVDDHAAWHLEHDGIKYGDRVPGGSESGVPHE